jgi:hypothetical protein
VSEVSLEALLGGFVEEQTIGAAVTSFRTEAL